MKRMLVLLTVVTLVVCAVSVEAQEIQNGALSGTVLSGVAKIAPGNYEIVLTVPGSNEGHFVLTQFCRSDALVEIHGGSPALTYLPTPDGESGCVDYNPGIVVPAASDLQCVSSSGVYEYCSVSGVLSRK